uniref:Uncharacterized protein n=1 Tax=Arundo donax TaxID=35708 RepID=A0A0A8Z6X8_ARUDO
MGMCCVKGLSYHLNTTPSSHHRTKLVLFCNVLAPPFLWNLQHTNSSHM